MKRRILVVGVGSIGERHVRCMLATSRAEVGICEINDDVRSRVAERYGLTRTYSSPEEALRDPWDAAVVASPAPSHIPISIQWAEAGRHLFIEKPLSTSLEGVAQLLQIVQSRKLVAKVAYTWHAHPGLNAMRDAIVSGQFGQAMQIVVVTGHDFAVARPAYREVYFADRARGGGAIQDAMTHMFNLGEWLVGPMSRIAVDAAHKVLEGVEVEDTVHAMTRHGSVMGSYCLNAYQAPTEVTVTVICEKGTARLELQESRWRWMTEPTGTWQDQPWSLRDRDEWFTLQENAFLDALDGEVTSLCTLEEGIQTLKVNLAALQSADNEGVWQNI